MRRLLPLAILVVPAAAAAQPAPPMAITERAEPTNSINVSPLGIVFGSYALTYEHLFAGQHGVIVEGIAAHSANDDSSQTQFGGAVGYRWHWRGRQNSGFLGVMLAQGIGTGDVKVDDMTYGMTVRSTTVTGNIGKRWMIGPVNITGRIGLGYGHYTVEAKDDSQAAKYAEDTLNDLLTLLPIGFDGELSVGLVF